MTYEKGLFAQADPGIVSGSTIERKKMSTKTIYKRIALVAVAALGFGVLTSVSPASAATPAFTGAAIGTEDGTTGTATAVTAVHGTVTRTAPRTWTAPLTLAVTATGLNATAEFTVAGTTLTAAGTATSALSDLAVSGVTATSATLTGTVTWTSAADTIASVLLAGDTYAMTYTVTVTGTDPATAAAVNVVLPSTAGTLIAPTAGTGSTASALLQQVAGQATAKFVSGASDTSYTVTSSGVGSILSATPAGGTATAAVNLNGSNPSGGVSWTPLVTIQTLSVLTTSAVAGTQTLTFQPVGSTGTPGTVITATITWGAAPAVSAQYSLLTLNAEGTAPTTATGPAADTTAKVVSATASATAKFRIQAVLKDQNDANINGLVLGASITSGPGTLGIIASNAGNTISGRSLTVLTGAGNVGSVSVFSDGNPGVSVITITATSATGVTTVLGTKSVTFVGSAATATVTQNLKVARAGTVLGLTPTTSRVAATTAATTPAFRASVVDAAGIAVVAGSTVRMVSSDETVIVPGTCAEYTVTGTAGAAVPAPGTFECSVSGANAAVSGKTATITFQVLNAVTGVYSIVAAPITFSVGGAIASTVVSANKTTFAPGEAIVMVATAKDSAGNAAFDGQNPYIATSANMSVGGALPTAAGFIVGGVHSTKSALGVDSLFAPGSTGALTVSGLTAATATAPAGAAFSASLTIASPANAEISALTTLVNSLIAKINALNKLVIKIQKKVRA
jgi:hypothetical protein